MQAPQLSNASGGINANTKAQSSGLNFCNLAQPSPKLPEVNLIRYRKRVPAAIREILNKPVLGEVGPTTRLTGRAQTQLPRLIACTEKPGGAICPACGSAEVRRIHGSRQARSSRCRTMDRLARPQLRRSHRVFFANLLWRTLANPNTCLITPIGYSTLTRTPNFVRFLPRYAVAATIRRLVWRGDSQRRCSSADHWPLRGSPNHTSLFDSKGDPRRP